MAAATDNALKTLVFYGKADEDSGAFLRHLRRYLAYKEITDNEKKLHLFAVHLIDQAGDWLDALPAAAKDTYAQLEAAFQGRYQAPDAVKYRSAIEVFGRKQSSTETSDDYVTAMRNSAALISIGPNEPALLYSVINGFRQRIQSQVTQRRPESLDAALDIARLAELSEPSTDEQTSIQVAAMRDELKQLSAQMSKMNVSAVAPRSRSPTPGPTERRVSFGSVRYGPHRLSTEQRHRCNKDHRSTVQGAKEITYPPNAQQW